MVDSQILKDIGFNEKESMVISHVAMASGTYIKDLSITTGLSKTTIVDVLDKLIKKGIIDFFHENKKKKYFLKHYSKIENLIDGKINLLKASKEIIKKSLSSQKVNSSQIIQECRGIEETKEFFMDMLYEKPKEITTICFSNSYPKELWEFMNNIYIPKRVELGIKSNLISNVSLLDSINDIQLRKRKPIKTKEIQVNIDLYNDSAFVLSYLNKNFYGFKIRLK